MNITAFSAVITSKILQTPSIIAVLAVDLVHLIFNSLHVHVHNAGNFQINSQFHTKPVQLQVIHTIHAVQHGKSGLECGGY
jgi:hypothetical protein